MGVNDVLEAANMMSASIDFDHTDIVGYEGDLQNAGDRNEAVWISNMIDIINGQLNKDPNYLAIKSVDAEGKMLGYMLAAVYNESYANKPVMDVKDMIVDYSKGTKANAMAVCECFDYMIEHTKKYGGKDWRADTIHSTAEAMKYVDFLAKRYDAKIKYGVRGII